MAEVKVKEVVVVPLLSITAGPNAVRADEEDPELVELAESIRAEGLINAIGVEEVDGQYVVVHGHRRFAACRMAGVAKVPVRVFEGSRSDLGRVVFAENNFRKNPTAVEQAAAISDRYQSGDMTLEEIARVFRRSTDWVKEQIALLGWPDDVLAALHARRISRGAASALAQVTDEDYRVFLVATAAESGATARTCEAWLSAWRSNCPPSEAVTIEAAGAGTVPLRPGPQAPCLMCGEVYAIDGLSSVLMCVGCVRTIRETLRSRG